MSGSSKSVHDAMVSLQDAANASIVFVRAASALREALTSVANLEDRIEALERAIVPPLAVDARVGGETIGVQATACVKIRSHVDTKTAADLLGRTPQTLRKWACYNDGPLRPVRVNGRLAWAVADIQRLLNVG